ncbi:MAG: FG-GAP repeat protein, partial [Myxococcota bacterium]
DAAAPIDAAEASVDGGLGEEAGVADGGPTPISPWPLSSEPFELTGSRVDSDALGADAFGRAVAISDDGNVIAIGAYTDDSSERGVNPSLDDDDLTNAGAAYVFRRASDGTWSEEAYLKAEYPDAQARFGIGIALSGDGTTLAVVADADRGAGLGEESSPIGSVEATALYLFRYNAGTWRQLQYLRVDEDDSSVPSLQLARNSECILMGGTDKSVLVPVDGRWLVRSVSGFQGARLQSDCRRLVWSRAADELATARLDPLTLEQSAPFVTSPPGGSAGSALGYRIRLSRSGDRMAASRHLHNSMGSRAGTILLFSNAEDAWLPETTLRSDDPIADGFFGFYMELSAEGTRVVASEARGEGTTRLHYAEQDTSPSRWTHRGSVDLADFGVVALAMDAEGNRVVVGSDDNRVLVLE